MWRAGATLHRSARASHCRGLSCCGAQAPDAQAQQLWLTGLVAPRHVGSSQTRVRTRVPCIGRQILNHCATREALSVGFLLQEINLFIYLCMCCGFMDSCSIQWVIISCHHFFFSFSCSGYPRFSQWERYTGFSDLWHVPFIP